jgi:DNA-binding transcriptional regulator YhcF (GntR family)
LRQVALSVLKMEKPRRERRLDRRSYSELEQRGFTEIQGPSKSYLNEEESFEYLQEMDFEGFETSQVPKQLIHKDFIKFNRDENYDNDIIQ